METKQCFNPNCDIEVEYVCQCTSPETYSCKGHFMAHCELRNRTHTFESVFLEPCEGTKDAILKLLTKEKAVLDEHKGKILASFSSNICSSENSLEDSLRKLESEVVKINDFFEKISKVKKLSKFEQDPIVKLLFLCPDEAIEKLKQLIPKKQDSFFSSELFCGLSDEIKKFINVLIETKIESGICSIEKRLEDYIASNSNQLTEIKNNMIDQWNEAEENRKSQNFKYEVINSLIIKLEDTIQHLNSKLYSIEKTFDENYEGIKELEEYSTEIMNEVNENKREFEDWKEEAWLKKEEVTKLLNSQIQKITEDINQRHLITDKRLDSFSAWINNNEKNKKEIEDLKQETEEKMKKEVNLLNSQFQKISEDANKGHFDSKRSPINFDNCENKIEENKNEEKEFISQISELKEDPNKEPPFFKEKPLSIANESLDLEISKLNHKKSKISNETNFSKIEHDFRRTCSWYNNEISNNPLNPSVFQAYQDYIGAYHKKTSLYLVRLNVYNQTELLVFNTENDSEEVIILDTPKRLNWGSCIAQLPNGELFCFGNSPASGISLKIDENYRIQILPSGTPSCWSSAIYFKRKIYCFGGKNKKGIPLALSESFNLDENRWIKLKSLPKADFCGHSIVFNNNILVACCISSNILRYLIEDNIFTIIPFEFAQEKRKILIYTNRLYLIECRGLIYESEIGNENAWQQINSSIIKDNSPSQAYCTYNKGFIYLGCSLNEKYYKFSLDQKMMFNL